MSRCWTSNSVTTSGRPVRGIGTVTGKWTTSKSRRHIARHERGARRAKPIASARVGIESRPGRSGRGGATPGRARSGSYASATWRLASTVTRSGPFPAPNSAKRPRAFVSDPPTRPGKRVRRLYPTCTEARCYPAMSSPRTLSARTAAATVTGQFAGRGATLLLTVATTAVVTRAIGADGFADWGTVLMLVALTSFALDPGIAPVVVRRLVQADESAPTPGASAPPAPRARAARLRRGGGRHARAARRRRPAPRPRARRAASAPGRGDERGHVAAGRAPSARPDRLRGGYGGRRAGAARGARGRRRLRGRVGRRRRCGPGAAAGRAHAARAGAALSACAGLAREGALDRGRGIERAAPLAGALVLVAVYTRIGIVFVNEGASSVEVADFSLAFLFVEQAIVVAGILGAALLPMLAVRTARLSASEDALAADLLVGMTLAGAATAVGLVAFADPLVALLGGSEFDGAVEILRLLAPACTAIFANFFAGYLFVALQRARLYLWFNLVGLIVSVVLGLTLTLNGGAPAAARVTWITEVVVVSCAVVPFLGRRADGARALFASRRPDDRFGAVRGAGGRRHGAAVGASAPRRGRSWPGLVPPRPCVSLVTCARGGPARARRSRPSASRRCGGRSAPRPGLAVPLPLRRARRGRQLLEVRGQLPGSCGVTRLSASATTSSSEPRVRRRRPGARTPSPRRPRTRTARATCSAVPLASTNTSASR